ncbi:SPOR domain-containing protein [Aquimarina sp. 2201CG1-2-11]|uniref:HU domain-containing protein n=1 Tax=Aquimarina discodermiae TaxID=3231043 RepID=UPI003461B570
MNNTAKYICELLYRYECVILPGFGAFLTRRQPATIQESSATFYPPKKLISFNKQLQNNDGLLANYIASAENISYTDALAKIQRYVLSLNEKISSGQRIELDKIGIFYTSVENTLQFEPLQDENYLTEAFGLSSFSSPVITREVLKEEVEALEESTPLTFTPEKRNAKPYLQYAAAAAIVFGMFGYLGLQKVSNNTISYNNSELKKANEEIESKIQEATFEISNPLPAIDLTLTKEEDITSNTQTTLEEGKFFIVAGAYRIADNANKKVQKLKAAGFTNAHVIGVNKYGLHQVAYENYQDRLEARQALAKIKNEQNGSAWLLIRN